ncbi:hypothetical protein [Planktotalea sp.]|uniref:hypothetical protein n=1 Tax=Planktotalea sp. TaxID=2029877 RepID=UPI003299CDB1
MGKLSIAIDWLTKSPMQRMSLGSRELFHSDFLSWLFETYPATLFAAFDVQLAACRVDREKRGLDITVCERGSHRPLLIIENKVKSYPDRAQLERYNAKFPSEGKRILLTLAPPSFDLPSPWTTLLYKDLEERLKHWYTTAKLAEEHRQYIGDYLTMIGHLSTVANECFDPIEVRERHFWFETEKKQSLSEIGFAQTLLKFEAMAFKDFMIEQVPAISKNPNFPRMISNTDDPFRGDHVNVWFALFNNTPCVTFEPVKTEPNSDGLRFEIQIQGTQYRRLVAGPPLRDISSQKCPRPEKAEKTWARLNELCCESWLFGQHLQRPQNGEKGFDFNGEWRRSRMSGDMCFYRPDVAYQYINIEAANNQSSLSVDQLPAQVARDIDFAFELLMR